MLLAFYQRPQIHNSKCTNPLINAQQNPTRRTMSNEDVLLFEHLRGKQIHFLNLHSKITVICPVSLSIYTSFLCTLPGSNSPGYNTRLQKGSEVHEIPEQQTWLGFKTLLGMLSKKPKISHNSVRRMRHCFTEIQVSNILRILWNIYIQMNVDYLVASFSHPFQKCVCLVIWYI